jgi:phosphoglycerate dehydrogenase-like enzyme
MFRIVYTGFSLDEGIISQKLNEGFEFIKFESTSAEPFPPEKMERFLKVLEDCDGYILGAGGPAGEVMLKRAKKLKAIVFFGSGYMTFIDTDYCRARGIKAGYCPGANSNAVAEFGAALTLAAIKDIVAFNNEVRAGVWTPRRTPDIFDKTVGFIGLGNIGARMAAMLHGGFGCKILYRARTPKPDLEARLSAVAVSMDGLLAASDVVVVAAAHTPETHGIIDAAAVSKMKRGCILVNMARAQLVDTQAVLDGVTCGRIAKYVTDVYHTDPVTADFAKEYAGKYLPPDKLVLTPHTSFVSADATRKMIVSSVRTICNMLLKQPDEGILDG